MNEIKTETKVVQTEDRLVPEYTIGLVKTTSGHTYFGLFNSEKSDWLILDKFSLCVFDYVSDDAFDEKYAELDYTEDLFTESLLNVCIEIYENFNLDEFNSSKIEIPSNCSDIDKEVFMNTVPDDYRYNMFVNHLTKQYSGKIFKLDGNNESTYIKIKEFYWNYDIKYVPYLYVNGSGISFSYNTDKTSSTLSLKNDKSMNYRLGDLFEIFLNKDSDKDYINQKVYEFDDSETFMNNTIGKIGSHYGVIIYDMYENILFKKEEEQN